MACTVHVSQENTSPARGAIRVPGDFAQCSLVSGLLISFEHLTPPCDALPRGQGGAEKSASDSQHFVPSSSEISLGNCGSYVKNKNEQQQNQTAQDKNNYQTETLLIS